MNDGFRDGFRDWVCVNGHGAIVYEHLYANEARLIAAQHGLRCQRVNAGALALQVMIADAWYAEEVKRMAERAPA